MKIKIAEHLYEIYPAMPRYANDPEQSEVVRAYDFILRRFQGFYGKQPKYFAKASASPILLGDQHQYVGYPYLSFSSTQDVIIAIAKSPSQKIRINNYQSAMYGQKVISCSPLDWKFDQKQEGDRFTNVFVKLLSVIAEEEQCKDFGGLDILIYSSFVQDQFMGWREALFATFYSAVSTTITNGKTIDQKRIFNALQKATVIDPQIFPRPQLTNYKYGAFTIHQGETKHIQIPEQLQLVLAHSMTPLPKKLIQGKRFNLRRCEVLIAIQYVKIAAGTTKDIRSLKQLQDVVGLTLQQLMKEIQQNVPAGKVTSEQIEQTTERSLIDILKEVPYANNVIDQNNEFFPRDRALFFLRQQAIIQSLTSQNLIASVRQSQLNQRQLLNNGSQQIDQLIEAAGLFAVAHRVIGNGWGGNVLFFCEKGSCGKLVDQIIPKFYLSSENKVLLSDDLQQYIQIVGQPGTGLAILDPQSQIWY